MCNRPKIFDAIIQHVAVDMVDKSYWLVAVVRPHKAVHRVELIHILDPSITVAVDSASGLIGPFIWSGPFPEKLAVFVIKKLFDLLARQVVVARVGLIRHR